MRILITGFQRSGTTLLRRLVTMHPNVRSIMHEYFLLVKHKDPASVKSFVKSREIKDIENWGDKTPYYPNIRRITVKKYFENWINIFGKKQSRIINVYRHPYDVAFSVDNKYKGQNFIKAISLYRRAIPRALETIDMPQVLSFKYEELVSNPDKIVPMIYDFCGLKQIDFRERMKLWENKKYQTFDASRIFAYKGREIPKIKEPLDDIIMDLNEKLGGPEYEV